MTWNRRKVLQSLGLGAGALMLSPWAVPRLSKRAEADNGNEDDHYFVFAYFAGGWDTLLCLDPRDPAVFTPAASVNTLIDPAYGQLDPTLYPQTQITPNGSNITWGPAIGNFAQHFDVSCVVRGVAMDTVTHQVGYRYFLTAEPPSGNTARGPSVGTRIVEAQGKKNQLANLVSGTEAYLGGKSLASAPFRIGNPGELLIALEDAETLDPDILAAVQNYKSTYSNCDPVEHNTHGIVDRLRTNYDIGRQIAAQGLADRFRFFENNAEMNAIRNRYGFLQNEAYTAVAANAALAYQAILHNMTQAVTIQLGRNLDTHNGDHLQRQPERLLEGFNALASLVSDLKATPYPKNPLKSLMEVTTLVVYSEFARTPLLNSKLGRDHWNSSACLLAGACVPHNRVVGATSNVGYNAHDVDSATGQPVDTGGVTITPTNVIASVMEAAGYDIADLRTPGLPCLQA